MTHVWLTSDEICYTQSSYIKAIMIFISVTFTNIRLLKSGLIEWMRHRIKWVVTAPCKELRRGHVIILVAPAASNDFASVNSSHAPCWRRFDTLILCRNAALAHVNCYGSVRSVVYALLPTSISRFLSIPPSFPPIFSGSVTYNFLSFLAHNHSSDITGFPQSTYVIIPNRLSFLLHWIQNATLLNDWTILKNKTPYLWSP